MMVPVSSPATLVGHRLAARLPAHPHHWALLIIVSLSLNLYAITWGLPNVVDWTNMSLAPLGPLTFAKRLLYGEPWLFHYPPLHFLILALVYSPYVLYLVLTGGLGTPADTYPFGLADPVGSLTVFTLLARLTSAVMGAGLVLVNYLTVRRFYEPRAALVSSLLVATAYPIVHYAHNAMVDVPYLFWLSLALYAFVRVIDGFPTRWIVLLALFTAFAVGTKHTAYALAVGLIPSLLYFHYRSVVRRHPGGAPLRAFVDGRLLAAAGLFCATVIVIFNPFLNWEGLVAHLARHTRISVGGSWVVQTAPGWLRGHADLAGQYVDYIRQSSGLPGFALIVAGFVYCLVRYPRASLVVTLPILTYYLLYLKNFGTHHLRYVLPVFVLCTWQAGRLASDALQTRWLPRPLPQLALAVVLGSSLLHGFTVNYLYVRDPRYAAESWIREQVPPGAKVLAVEPDYSLPRLPQTLDVTYRDLWDFNGRLLSDITDLDVDYVVAGMSIPRRSQPGKWKHVAHIKDIDVNAFLAARGYEAVTSFKTSLPAWGADVPDIHVVNPRVSIWKRSGGHRPPTSQAALHAVPTASGR
jgi:hypothetical protein